MTPTSSGGLDRARAAAAATVATLVRGRSLASPNRIAVDDGRTARTYAELVERVARWAAWLRESGIHPGDRIAVLSRNRTEYIELFLAAAWTGAVVACQNWRLAQGELDHCLDLVTPRLTLCSRDFTPRTSTRAEPTHTIEDVPLASLDAAAVARAREPVALDPEHPLLILYTSGTTGLPKGAVISHRAEITRQLVLLAEYGISPGDDYVAWSPLYHMGGADYSLGTLMSGGTVFVVDGFDAERLALLAEQQELGWLLLMPGMVGRFADVLEQRKSTIKSVKVCGVMADLVPGHDIARITRLLDAPYANTFGSTETGCPPCSSSLLPIGVVPTSLSKRQSPFCEVRLVDEHDEEVGSGEPGELCMRGPTLFSGYFENEAANADSFKNGWFHMGDVFVRNGDGTLDFVDRRKYLIKSGGENIYPAEIERVLLMDERVREAAVVRQKDEKWGEVPIAFVARASHDITAEELIERCRRELASYKRPKGVHFIDYDAFPRSASGKVVRHELENRLKELR